MQNPVILSANSTKSLVQNVVAEELVTTKELAQMLGVEVTAIKRAVQKLGAVLHRVERNNQGGYLFTEKQATIIKQEIQKHHNLATRRIDTVSTEEKVMTVKEIAETLKVAESTIRNIVGKHGWAKNGVQTKLNENQVTIISREMKTNSSLAHQQEDSLLVTSKVSTKLEVLENYKKATEAFVEMLASEKEEFRKRAEIAESALNRIGNGTGCFSMNQTAKELKLPYGNIKLYERLRSEGILNADNSPKQEQVNAGHFKVVVKFVNEKIGNKPVTLTTGRGLVYLAKRFNTQIDESVRADEQ